MARPRSLFISYLAAVLAAEVVVRALDPGLGLAMYCIALIAALHHAAFRQPRDQGIFLAIGLVPLARILNLTLPLGALPMPYWQLAVAAPIVVAVALAARAAGYSRTEIGLVAGPRAWLLAILMGPTWFVWGMIGYTIIRPMPLVSSPRLEDAVAPAVALMISTGIAEELLFRGVIQGAAMRRLGSLAGAAYATVLFAAIAADPWNTGQLALALSAGALLAAARAVTGSILPAAAAHGAFNVGLLLVAPFLLQR